MQGILKSGAVGGIYKWRHAHLTQNQALGNLEKLFAYPTNTVRIKLIIILFDSKCMKKISKIFLTTIIVDRNST